MVTVLAVLVLSASRTEVDLEPEAFLGAPRSGSVHAASRLERLAVAAWAVAAEQGLDRVELHFAPLRSPRSLLKSLLLRKLLLKQLLLKKLLLRRLLLKKLLLKRRWPKKVMCPQLI